MDERQRAGESHEPEQLGDALRREHDDHGRTHEQHDDADERDSGRRVRMASQGDPELPCDQNREERDQEEDRRRDERDVPRSGVRPRLC